MATAKINVCTDAKTKAEAENILADLGLNMTAAVNIYLKRIIMEGGIPFELSTRVYNKKTEEALNEFDEMKKSPEKYKRYKNFDSALNDVL